MPSFRPLPQELVDKILDELGEDYQVPDHKKCPDDHIRVTGEALHACALVSKNWTGRSRAHLFKKVKVRGDDIGSFRIPPETIMPHITKLKIQLRSEKYRLFPSTELLTPFYASPIVCLRITEGTLAPGRAYLVEFISALSATLQTVTFKSCTLSPDLIHDTVLAHPGLEQLHLRGCEVRSTNSDNPTMSHSSASHSVSLELGVFGGNNDWRGQGPIATVVQLPIKFCKLNFDYVRVSSMAHSANTLIEANSETLSSLTVNILVSLCRKNEPLFSLRGCSNLSVLSLDMERTNLCLVTTTAGILSTLGPIQHTRLEWVRLATKCLYRWICRGSRDRLIPAWSSLDTTLSELARVTFCVNEKRSTFVLVSVCNGECIPFARKWLPELLPRFHGLGELRIGHERSRLKTDNDRGCFCDHEPICPED